MWSRISDTTFSTLKNDEHKNPYTRTVCIGNKVDHRQRTTCTCEVGSVTKLFPYSSTMSKTRTHALCALGTKVNKPIRCEDSHRWQCVNWKNGHAIKGPRWANINAKSWQSILEHDTKHVTHVVEITIQQRGIELHWTRAMQQYVKQWRHYMASKSTRTPWAQI